MKNNYLSSSRLYIGALIIIIIGLLLFIYCEQSDRFVGKTFDSKTFNVQNNKKIKSYRVILPVKNEGKGYLILNFEGNGGDTSRISTVQMAAITNILKESNVLFNSESKSLILEADSTVKESLTLNP